MQSTAKSPDEYFQTLPNDRKSAMADIRQALKNNLPEGFKEGMGYGMLCYSVPHSIYPAGYHCDPKLPLPFISLASQKNFIALYHMGLYANKKMLDWFVAEYPKHAKYKLDMGKSCIRFKKMDDIPLALIGELARKITVADWIKTYEAALAK
jgi:hypothetical protein